MASRRSGLDTMKRNILRVGIAVLIFAAAVLVAKRTSAPATPAMPSGETAESPSPAPGHFFELLRVSEVAAPGFHQLQSGESLMFVSDTSVMDDGDVVSARPVRDPAGDVKVELVFSPEGRARFAAGTRVNLGQALVLLIDGHVETMLAFDQPIDEPSVQISKADSPTMEAAAEFAARFGRIGPRP